MSSGLYRLCHTDWWETKVALNMKEYGLILRESDLVLGHPLGQCCDGIHNSQEIPRSTRDVLWWLLRCGADSIGTRVDESRTETGCSPLGRSSAKSSTTSSC